LFCIVYQLSLQNNAINPCSHYRIQMNKHNDVYSFGYDSGNMDLSRYFEETIDILYKNGKKYLEFKGTGMSTFVEALYVDGEKMAIKENDDGSYIAQIEYDKELD